MKHKGNCQSTISPSSSSQNKSSRPFSSTDIVWRVQVPNLTIFRWHGRELFIIFTGFAWKINNNVVEVATPRMISVYLRAKANRSHRGRDPRAFQGRCRFLPWLTRDYRPVWWEQPMKTETKWLSIAWLSWETATVQRANTWSFESISKSTTCDFFVHVYVNTVFL